jgi:S1-C subfamily serine protease
MVKASVAAFILVLGLSSVAQSPLVQLSTHAVLVDKDLNQKPIPRLTVLLTRLDATPAQTTTLKTGFDGKAEAKLPPGKYRLTTPEPVSFQDKRYRWEIEVVLSDSAQIVELSNDNAVVTADSPAPSYGSGDLTALFDRLKNSVVTVRAESKDGSGFLVDPAGLIVTNNHVVESSGYLAVQFDQKRKVPARLLAANADKDLAVLWVDLSVYPQAVVAPLVVPGASGVAVGERVFTIGNPLGREKVLTTGVISKVESDAITSDININPGNSGGPLLTLQGQVVGITTAGLRNLAKIVPIEPARTLIEQARAKMAGSSPPPADLLPVEPVDYFPADTLKALLQLDKLDTKPYFFDAGEFRVGLLTPTVNYFLRHEDEMAAARKSAKRNGGDASQAKPPSSALEDAQDYRPVLIVSVRPKLGVVWKVRFKNGFQRMRLLCGSKEVTPIDPGRRPYELVDLRGRTMDTTFQGTYVYLPDAVSPSCGGVVLEIFSEKDPKNPITKAIEAETIERVWADWEPYRKAHVAAPSPGAKKN